MYTVKANLLAFFYISEPNYHITDFHCFTRAFFNSVIDKHQHMHFFTFKTVLV